MALTTLGVLPPAQLPRFAKGGRIAPLPASKSRRLRSSCC